MKKRIEYIDAMRGFTMLLIVMHHIKLKFSGNNNFEYTMFVFIIETLGLPIFFFISGWVFYKADRLWSMSSVKNILQKKFVVLFIPFSIFLLSYLYIFKLLSVNCLGSDKTGYWFTFVLFEYFGIYVLTERLLNKRNLAQKEIWVGSTMILISVLSFCYAKYYVQYSAELGSWKAVLGFFSFVKFKHLIFFWLGTIAKRFFSDFIKFTDNRYAMSGMVLLFFTIALCPHVNDVLGEYFIYVTLGFAGICVVFTFFRVHETLFLKTSVLGCMLQFVGRRTLDIYLLHYFFLPQNLEFIGSFLKQYNNRAIDVLIMLFLAIWIIAICLLVSEIIRLSPLLKYYCFGVQRKRVITMDEFEQE